MVGDAAAHQIARGARAFADANRDAALRLGQNLAEYWTEESPLLARWSVWWGSVSSFPS